MSVYIYIHDGLGNQMFKIAVAYAYARDTGRILRIIKEKKDKDKPEARGTYWTTALTNCVQFLVDTIDNNHKIYKETTYVKYLQLPDFIGNNVLLDGWFITPKYFNKYQDDIRSLFYPSPESIEKVYNLYGKYISKNTVTVHARRGDYVRFAAEFGPLTVEYYKNATNIILENILNPIFLLVSDDDSYWSTIIEHITVFQQYEYIIVPRDSLTDYETLALFSQVKNLIIANSTFSWWGAYLADTNMVVAPKQWVGPKSIVRDWNDIYCDNWIRV